MKDWQVALDRYLTTPPPDHFNDWAEQVIGNHISDQFYVQHERWLESDDVCTDWLNRLFNREYSPQRAACIIERAHALYINRATTTQ